MMTTLRDVLRTARKPHRCNYCGNVIPKGAKYHYSTHVFDNTMYCWKCHDKCADLASVIWDIVDPDEGMTHEDFCDKLREVANTFICPECPRYDAKGDDCDNPLDMECINHIHAFFQEHALVMKEPYVWKCVKKEGGCNG